MSKIKPFTEEELDLFFYTIGNVHKRNESLRVRDLVIYSVLRYTGARIGEVLRMNLNQFDFAENVWTIPSENSKNGYEQKVFLIPMLRNMLKKYVELYNHKFKEGFLMWPMWKAKSKKKDSRHLDPCSWRLQHKIYLQKAGLLEQIGIRKDGSPRYARNTHSIRSTYAIKTWKELVAPGKISPLEAKELTRHRSIKSYLHYVENLGLIQEEVQKRWLPEVFN